MAAGAGRLRPVVGGRPAATRGESEEEAEAQASGQPPQSAKQRCMPGSCSRLKPPWDVAWWATQAPYADPPPAAATGLAATGMASNALAASANLSRPVIGVSSQVRCVTDREAAAWT